MLTKLINRVRTSQEVFLSFLLFFVSLIRQFGLSGDIKIFYDKLTILSRFSEVQIALGESDPGQLLKLAHVMATFGSFSPDAHYWIIRTWSIGQSFLFVPLLWLEKLGIPFALSVICFTNFLLFFLFRSMIALARTTLQSMLIFGLIFVFLFSYDFASFTKFNPFNSDTDGILSFAIAFLILTRHLIENTFNKRVLFKSVLLLSFAVHVRYPFEQALFLIAFCSLIFLISHKFKTFRRKTWREMLRASERFSICFNILLASSLSLLTTLPYRIWTLKFGQNPLQMSSAFFAYAGPNLWALPNSQHALYWDSVGMNWACDLAPQKCIELNQAGLKGQPSEVFESVKVIILNPIDFLNYKLHYFFANHTAVFSVSSLAYWISIFSLFMIFFCVILLKKLGENREILFFLWVPATLSQITSLVMIHFETRYFIPLHLLSLCWLAASIASLSPKSINPIEDELSSKRQEEGSHWN